MIVRITGLLADISDESVVIDRDGVAYEVHAPKYALGELSACRGKNVTLHTIEYLEGNPAGGNLTPRLVGFLYPEDRAFFEQFTTVKGVGIRKGLRALAEPVTRIARDIESADTRALARLPGIGPRMAAQIVAELRGKLGAFAMGGAAVAVESAMSREQRDALELLVAWGDPRAESQRWLERAGQLHPELQAVEEWVKAAYRIKTGAE